MNKAMGNFFVGSSFGALAGMLMVSRLAPPGMVLYQARQLTALAMAIGFFGGGLSFRWMQSEKSNAGMLMLFATLLGLGGIALWLYAGYTGTDIE